MNKSESKYFNTAVRMDKAFLELLDTKDFEYITVKEICERAGVNRSTFYLHYETVADLLQESVEYMNRQFDFYFKGESVLNINQLDILDLESLYLITPQYLKPYLEYVRDHKRLFQTVLRKAEVFGSQHSFNALFHHVFSPIMDRYDIAEEKREYIISFYISGMISVIKKWLDSDCREPIKFILNLITECVKRP